MDTPNQLDKKKRNPFKKLVRNGDCTNLYKVGEGLTLKWQKQYVIVRVFYYGKSDRTYIYYKDKEDVKPKS